MPDPTPDELRFALEVARGLVRECPDDPQVQDVIAPLLWDRDRLRRRCLEALDNLCRPDLTEGVMLQALLRADLAETREDPNECGYYWVGDSLVKTPGYPVSPYLDGLPGRAFDLDPAPRPSPAHARDGDEPTNGGQPR